jgi:pyridoxine 5'-phosphate synthase PdxJ
VQIIESYKDLCNEIKAFEARIKAYIARKNMLLKILQTGPKDIKAINYQKEHVQSPGQLDMEESLPNIAEMISELNKIEHHLELHTETLEKMYEAQKEMQESIERLEGLQKKVIYMRDIEGKKLIDIAQELDYSYDYIREISAKHPRATHRQA